MLTKGKLFETYAKNYLEKKGLIFVESDYRTKYGEIDLIMFDDDCLVFIEVKYRKNSSYGNVSELLSKKKIERIWTSARIWGQQNNYNLELNKCRLDYVYFQNNSKQISWIKNINDF